ncbi:1-phosphofructokinase family hexose kinase [Robbsia sp. Bb-Pol-6]|uniref:1-phosphofructokinase family hexose kinase n=1 Tax=Robbsia betulipollinis TaxID=2981849 RepID=A0ABT3ZR81_9BURK|nr:1-phosphofructokinase family hexose kinase [Robbsia betulipollinis]MCY0389050.1 1-phosphofructokinase family hexose kinase [Robbsia betulipollinis]
MNQHAAHVNVPGVAGSTAVVTVTVNPALDQTVCVNGLQTGAVNLGESLEFNAGGKGVNVASCLADYGLRTTVTGLLGRDDAQLFDALFASKRIDDRFVRVAGRPRINVKLVDLAHGQTTDINLASATPADADLLALEQAVLRLAAPGRWFVLAGSLPPGVDPGFYRRLTRTLRQAGARVALDTSGAPLTASLAPGLVPADDAASLPDLIKPNRAELEKLVGRALPDRTALEGAAAALLARGVACVVVSLGEDGAFGLQATPALNMPDATPHSTPAPTPQPATLAYAGFRASPLRVPVTSTVGAGDAFVAGLVASLIEGRAWPECGRRATAFAAGKLARVGPHLPSAAALDALAQQVHVETFVGSVQRAHGEA